MDLGSQAKFSFEEIASPGYTTGDVVYGVYEHFGIIVVQANPTTTVSLPTTGLSATTRNYLRQITSSSSSSNNLTVDLDGSNTVTLIPGATCFVFWDGAQWMTFPSQASEAIQGRIEAPAVQAYLVIRGGAKPKYLDRITFNVDSGSGEIGVLTNGLTSTLSNVDLIAGTESQYTFSPKIEILEPTTIALNFSGLVNLEGVHYRIDLDDTP